MCGITGAIWSDPKKAINGDTLRRMTEVLSHRGPDDYGVFEDAYRARRGYNNTPGIALGHRRLSIIDLASGRQPLANEDESVWVVANGEIYNYRELRKRLEGSGHRFRTDSDTEVIVHLYEDLGTGMLELLDGMFALAVWDAKNRQLLLARDRLGQKPLVYRHEAGRLLFASELKSLLEVTDVPRDISHQAIDEYLTYQYVPHPHTIFRGINKLPPAHFALWRDGRLRIDSYWSPNFNLEEPRSYRHYADELRELLTDAVRRRLQSDVPLGVFLSGGVDSTVIVGLMQSLVDEPVRTFSIGFPVPEYDETSYARLVAEKFGTVHEEFRVEPDAVGILDKLVWHYDEPFADSSAIPTWYVSELTRRHVTVALTGDGGDELFTGYPRYRAVRLGSVFDAMPSLLRRGMLMDFWQKMPASPRQKSVRRRFKRFIEALGNPPRRRYLEWISIFGESRRAALYTEQFLESLSDTDPMDFLDSAFDRSNRRDQVTATCLTDLVTYLPCDLMTKVDIASMAHGLECRQPFLDHRLVELAARMPIDLKYRRGIGKRILLETFSDIIPKSIAHRKKMGFSVPLDAWFRGPLVELSNSVLLDQKSLARGFFRPESIRTLLEEHQQAHFDHSYRLWSLLVLELWLRRWVD